tara:strand:+ start:689 stop:1081 length:393 start_codon:yes stop_codon:yes gene_type:complete
MKTTVDSVYVRLQPSKIHGVGVFAIKMIPKNFTIFKSTCLYTKTPISSLDKLSEPEKSYYLDFFVQEDNFIYLPSIPVQSIDISFFLNHDSTFPNVKYDYDLDSFVTLMPIPVGTELVYDYSSVEDEIIL